MDFDVPWHHSDLHQIQLVDDINLRFILFEFMTVSTLALGGSVLLSASLIYK